MKAFIKELAEFKRQHWLMLLMLFVMKIGQFMFLPFLAIFLSNHDHLQPVMIGVIVGAGPLTFGLSSFVAGVMIDHYGVRRAIMCSLLVSGLVIYFFFYSHAIPWLILMSMLTGLTRAFFDIGSKSYGVFTFSYEQKRIFFSLRSMFINTAAAIGPVLGAYLTTIDANLIFKIIGLVYALLSVLAFFILEGCTQQTQTESLSIYHSIHKVFKMVAKDKVLLMLIAICIIFWGVYSQIDSTLAQHLTASLPDGIKIYSILLIINAVGCAVLQMIMMKLTTHVNELVLAMLAMCAFALANIIFGVTLHVPLLITATFLIVLSEIIIMPLNDMLITKIAPPALLGAYYGAMGLGTLGLGIGPFIGECIYQYIGPPMVFIFCAFCCLFCIYLYRQLTKKMHLYS